MWHPEREPCYDYKTIDFLKLLKKFNEKIRGISSGRGSRMKNSHKIIQNV